jgi:hypothetical protein
VSPFSGAWNSGRCMDEPLPEDLVFEKVDYWINARSGEMIASYTDDTANLFGDDWIHCEGQAIVKALEPRLCRLLNGQYGEDDTHFWLPDMQGVKTYG